MKQARPTFIIGLGGVGNQTLRLVYERFLSATERGDLPPLVLLRSIDTTGQGRSWADPLPDEMFTQIGDFDADQVVNHLDAYPEIKKWYKYPKGSYAPGFVNNGAQAKRPVGRICFFQQFNKIKAALEKDFARPRSTELANELMKQNISISLNPNVFIVGSLAGGTCSGMFIDTAFVVRNLLENLGYTGIRIMGILAMPSVIHVDSRDIETDSGLQRRLNAVGALQELDALMASWEPGEREVVYPELGTIRPTPPLFDQVFLVSQTKQDGMQFVRGKDIMIRVAHFLFAISNADIGSDVQDYQVNIPDKIDPSQRRIGDGQLGIYCSIGTEWLEIPMHDLVTRYAATLGPQIAGHIKGGTQDAGKKELEQEILGRLPADVTNLKQALDILRRNEESLLTVTGLQGLEAQALAIRDAEKRNEIRMALDDFTGALPAAITNLKSKLRIGELDTDTLERWIRGLRREWVTSSGVGLQGAAARFRAGKELFSLLDSEPVQPTRDIGTVLDECGGGFLRKSDSEPAYRFALERLAYEVRKAIQEVHGELASRLAVLFDRQTRRLENISEILEDSLANLRVDRATGDDLPQEMWMVDPNQVVESMSDNLDAMASEVASKVIDRMIDRIMPDTATMEEWSREEIASFLNKTTVDAIKTAASRQIKRPVDIVDRLKRRMSSCYPMMKTEDRGGHLYREFFGNARQGEPAEIKIVSTAIEGEDWTRVKEWADGEKERVGTPYAFQIVQSTDHMRDDLVNITLGWPLWLFSEVRGDWSTAESVRKNKPSRYNYCLIMNEFDDVRKHTIKPMAKDEIWTLFGLALVLKHVTPTPMLDRIEFDPDVFGLNVEALDKDSSSLEMFNDARSRFEQAGLARKYREFIDARLDTSEGVVELRDQILQNIEIRRRNLDDNQARGRIDGELSAFLKDHYNRAEQFAQKLLVF